GFGSLISGITSLSPSLTSSKSALSCICLDASLGGRPGRRPGALAASFATVLVAAFLAAAFFAGAFFTAFVAVAVLVAGLLAAASRKTTLASRTGASSCVTRSADTGSGDTVLTLSAAGAVTGSAASAG